LDLGQRFTYVNQAVLRMAGYTPDEWVGTRLSDHCDQVNFAKMAQAVSDELSKGTEASGVIFEAVMLKKNKEAFPVEIHARVLFDEYGAPLSLQGVTRDITDRKRMEQILRESEEKYRFLVEESFDGLFLMRGTKIVFTNSRLREMLGYGEDELEGRNHWTIYHPDYYEITRSRARARMRGEPVISRYEVKLLRKDGSTLDCELVAKDVHSGGEPGIQAWFRDITDRKKAEEALAESEFLYRTLFEGARDAIMLIDMEQDGTGRIVSANPVAAKIHGYSLDEFMTLRLEDLETPESSKGLPARVETALSGQLVRGELNHRRKDGSVFPVDVSANLYEIRGHQYCIAIDRDISERKSAEDALRESEERFRTVFRTSPDAVIINRLNDGAFIEVNDRFTDLTGLSREEVMGMPSVDTNVWVDLRDRQRVLDGIAQHGKVNNLEARFRMRDGSVKTGLLSATLTSINGEPHLLSIIRDIDDIKRAQEESLRLATAVEQSAETVIITNDEGDVVYVNPAFERTTGYSRQETIGNNTRMLKSGHHDEEFYKHMWNTISRGIAWRGRLVTKKKDGTLFEEDASISPVTDHSGTIVNYVAVKRDISQEVSLQRQLSQAQKMEAIGTLAGGIAHDFNNVLQVVLGYSEIVLEDEALPERYQPDLKKIYDSATRGADLVQRLLTFSRKTESNPQPIDLNLRITELRKMLERTIPKMIDIQLLQDLKLAKINADKTQIDQVLMNLAVNARDAMPEGGKLLFETANVTIDEEYARTNLDAEPGPHVLLTVKDTGMGIDKDTLEHIFEPFYTTKGVGEGSGLGLAMVHGIVKHHGGYIKCYSEPGQGATFKIYFPAMIAEEEQKQTEDVPDPESGTETILVVDDEEYIRDLGSRFLKKAGYEVITASNGKEALDTYQERGHKIALVLLDLMMPEMGGKQCLEELLQLNPSIKVVIASGYAANGPTKDALEAGAKGFVNKPYNMRQVRKVVREILDEE
jgi:two-component system, cell cycle sensor histidine kinase and response regulator CckA